jgi:hypothetical protein
MIVASLLLILVAVTLLVLGLTGGSSNLLISSIVASLLAAVALVIGARQSASTRRAAEAGPAQPDFDEPEPRGAEPRFAESPFAEPPFGQPSFAQQEFAQQEFAQQEFAEPHFAAERAADDDDFPPPPPPSASFATDPDSSDRRETVQFASDAGRADDFDEQFFDDEAYGTDRQHVTTGASGAPADVGAEPAAEHDPDYERAAGAIHAARSEHPDEHSWRRGEPGGHAEAAGLADEFAQPDDDDPADEPLPQSVRPADAVRLAQLDAEVLVVDGRPRYHLASCSHLVGRLTEPIPVNEAVDLGFNPCGLCRPVDHLVAAASRR